MVREAPGMRSAAVSSTKEGVRDAFLAECAGGAVPADEADVVAERQELLLDGPDQQGVIAPGQVRPADRPAKEHVAHESEAVRRVDEDDASWRMARAMEDIEGDVRDRNPIA